jgi:hypothetical protein
MEVDLSPNFISFVAVVCPESTSFIFSCGCGSFLLYVRDAVCCSLLSLCLLHSFLKETKTKKKEKKKSEKKKRWMHVASQSIAN